MGQTESHDSFAEALESIRHSIVKQARILLDISLLTHKQFLMDLEELNRMFEVMPGRLMFLLVVNEGSDASIFWKATTRLTCFKVNKENKKKYVYRVITLKQFIIFFRAFKKEINLQKQYLRKLKSRSHSESSVDALSDPVLNDDSSEAFVECCICLEKKPEVTLPCTHSYCQTCINQWSVENNTCPVCREVRTNKNEEWLLADAPNFAEITEHIATSLMDLSADRIS